MNGMELQPLIRQDVPFVRDGQVVRFILDEEARPAWSKALEGALNGVDLCMPQRYQAQRKIMTGDTRRKRFVDFVSGAHGVKVDLASGPSGYFAAMLDRLEDDDFFIVTDACPSVIAAHAKACERGNCFIFDVDLDQRLPFADESVDAFSGNLLNNVDHYAELIREIHRCLKPGGRFAAIELFFDHGCKTFEHLNAQGAVWASFETFVAFCEGVGFRYLDSDVLLTRKGRIAEGDLYPLDPDDGSTDRTIYFEKR